MRATGKTVLAKRLTDRYIDLGNVDVHQRAVDDPRGWLESLSVGTAVDEAQLVPGLTLAAKSIVDERGAQPGQFLLTGSARLSRTELGGANALALRERRFTVRPFAQCEIEGRPADVITALFEGDPREWRVAPVRHAEMCRRFASGGLPLVRLKPESERRIDLLQYPLDLFDGSIHSTAKNRDGIVRLFRYLASTSGALENLTDYGQKVDAQKLTIHGYLEELRQVFLIETLHAFRPNPEKRVTATRRVFVADSAFTAIALGIYEKTALIDATHGRFLETVVATELLKLMGWSQTEGLQLMHWRKDNNREVDIVVERSDGRVVAIEVKAARSVGRDHTKGIIAFRNEYPAQFHRGYVIHSGDRVERLTDDVWAIPFSALWTIGTPVGLTDEPPVSLEDRLARARQVIEEADATRQTETVLRESLLAERIANAEQQFADQVDLFAPVEAVLGELGLDPVHEPLVGSTPFDPPSNGVVWHKSRSLRFTIGATTLVLRLQARVRERDADQVEWLLSVNPDGGDFGGIFTTPWMTNPGPEVEARFALFADELPAIVEARRSPAD